MSGCGFRELQVEKGATPAPFTFFNKSGPHQLCGSCRHFSLATAISSLLQCISYKAIKSPTNHNTKRFTPGNQRLPQCLFQWDIYSIRRLHGYVRACTLMRACVCVCVDKLWFIVNTKCLSSKSTCYRSYLRGSPQIKLGPSCGRVKFEVILTERFIPLKLHITFSGM